MNYKVKKLVLGLLLPFAVAAPLSAQLPKLSIGWAHMAGSKLESVCPANNFGGYNYEFASKCDAVVTAWNSGALDTKRNRLVVWGGGHSDYSGNEMYALELATGKFQRITDPAPPISDGCPEAIADGSQPNSRHTYDGISYIANTDRLFVMGGSLASCGFMSKATWTFDFATSKWQNMAPAGTNPNPVPGIVSAYDPNTGKVFVHDDGSFYSYDMKANRYTVVATNKAIDYHMTAAIDPKRKKFVVIGGGQQWVYDIGGGDAKQQPLGSVGGSAVIGSNSPGLSYDVAEDRMVAWHGGNTAYALDMDKKIWIPITFAGGPGTAITAGTNGRWEYAPSINAFVVVNGADISPYVFKWSAKTVSTVPKKAPPVKSRRGAQLRIPGLPLMNLPTPAEQAWDMGGRTFEGGSNQAGNTVRAVIH